MEILIINNFYCEGCTDTDTTINLSMHCHATPSDEIAIYGYTTHKYLSCYSESITFPKVVYVDSLSLGKKIKLVKVLPDLKKIGTFWPNPCDIDDFGKIQEINKFTGMTYFLHPVKRDYFKIKTTCEPLGNKMFRFTSEKGYWDIKVNQGS